MIDINVIRAQFADIHAEAVKFAEDNKEKEVPAEEQAKQEARFSQMDKLQKQLNDAEKLLAYKFSKNEVQVSEKKPDQIAFEKSENIEPKQFDFDNEDDRKSFGKALGRWATDGAMPAEFSTLTTATSSSAYLPKQVTGGSTIVAGNSIREGMAAVGATPVSLGSTADWNEIVILPAAGSDLTEGNDSGGENNSDGSAAFSKINLKCYGEKSGQIWISNMESRAVNINLLDRTVPALQGAKELRLETKVLSAMAADGGITRVTQTTGDVYADLSALNNSLPKAFDRQKFIVLNSEYYADAVAFRGADGHPVLITDPQNQTLVRFNGTPVIKTDALSGEGSNNIVGLLISCVGFRLRDEDPVEVIRYPNDPAHTGDTGLDLVAYHSHGYLPQSVAKLEFES